MRKIAICLFAHFIQIKWATVSDSLRSLKTNEQLWANCSGRSYQKRDREWIAHDKWGTGTFLLRSLTKNERFAQQFLAKKSKTIFFSMFYIRFLFLKMCNVSKSLKSLTKNERPWAIRSGCSPKVSEWANHLFFWGNHSFAHFFAKNERFAQKHNEVIPSPDTIPHARTSALNRVAFWKWVTFWFLIGDATSLLRCPPLLHKAARNASFWILGTPPAKCTVSQKVEGLAKLRLYAEKQDLH